MKGKVKELFEKWFAEYSNNSDFDVYHVCNELETDDFDLISHLPPSMQWGVMQDFYDSQGIYITMNYDWVDGPWYLWDIITADAYDEDSKGIEMTRPEARESALKKAEEILEEKL